MGNPRGVKRDFDQLEKRRLSAVALFKQGLNNSDIGRRLAVSNQTISRWRKQFQTGGKESLAKAGRAGRMPLLNQTQLEQLVDVLSKGPEAYGYQTPLWTCDRVAHAIDQEFGVSYHPGHVWKILHKLNWSPQMPVGRAIERDETAIEDWKKHRWPAIKKKRARKGVRSSSSTKAD